MNDPCQANELFSFNNDEYEEVNFPLATPLVQREQQKELNQRNYKTKGNITKEENQEQDLDGVEIISHKRNIYVPKSLRRHMIIWYHLYINQPGADILANTTKQVCYWKGIKNQERKFANHCKECQTQKKCASRYGPIPPKNIS